jgi:curved DNA-binding protein CbpA
LGVARAASSEEIKQAFRQLARLYHPDVAKNKVGTWILLSRTSVGIAHASLPA